MTRQDLKQRVTQAAEEALAEQQFVSAIDVLLGLGWLAPSHLDRWRQGRIESLERVVQANLSKVTMADGGVPVLGTRPGPQPVRDRIGRRHSLPPPTAVHRLPGCP